MDHEEAGPTMSRGQGFVAAALAALVVAGAMAAERSGPATPASAVVGEAASGTWLCPHGGGPGWAGTIALANPGAQPVQARVTSIDRQGPGRSRTVTVGAGAEVLYEVPAKTREASTYVEYFGGWIAAAWTVRATDPDTGIGTEPCAVASRTRWFTTETSTEQGQAAFLVVMNAHAVDAVFDLALFSPGRPPLRDTDWSDVVLGAGRSMAVRLDRELLGEEAVGAQVDAKVGRVAVATLGVTQGGGVRSVLGATEAATNWILPAAAGSGQALLMTFVPGEQDVRLGATRLSSDGAPQPAGGLIDAQQPAQSAQAAPVITAGPSAVQLESVGGVAIVAAQRAQGQSADDAATGGATMPASAWVVPPTAADDPSEPGLVVVNPGGEPVTVTFRLLLPGDEGPGRSVTLDLPAASTASPPRAFLASSPQASVLVTATGDVVAMGASTSGGLRGLSLYGFAMGMPVPDGILADG
jgi:hypothetical protein